MPTEDKLPQPKTDYRDLALECAAFDHAELVQRIVDLTEERDGYLERVVDLTLERDTYRDLTQTLLAQAYDSQRTAKRATENRDRLLEENRWLRRTTLRQANGVKPASAPTRPKPAPSPWFVPTSADDARPQA